MDTIGVIGAGQMGAGIAQTLAQHGYRVLLSDIDLAAAEKGKAGIDKGLARLVAKDKLAAADAQAALARIEPVADLAPMSAAIFIIEAATETERVKQSIFEAASKVLAADAILASNTSSIPITRMANWSADPARFIGLHFFNPAPVMRLVEVVRTVSTSPVTLATAVDVTQRAGRHPVVCGDRAGFIVNALLFPYLNDAVGMLEANYASADDIDLAMKKGCGYPMGPFELLDTVGLDVSLAIQRTLYLEFREPGFAPAPRLEHLVTAGYLGRKSGKGFYDYK